MGEAGQNQIHNFDFCHFLKCSSLVFLEIAYNDSLERCLTTGRGITREKKLWEGGDKLGPKLRFLPFSQGCIISFP